MSTVAKSQTVITQEPSLSVESLVVVGHGGLPVLTTEILANLYGTAAHSITKNHRNNARRFVCGKHYFKLEGIELKEFKNKVTNSDLVANRAKHLILWTERGAARHAKMLETDQAWEVFERLEDQYFSQKEKTEQVRKNRRCSAAQLTPLRQTAERLITTGLGKIYPDIWKLVHRRFDVEHIHQLQPEQISEAIEFLNVLEGEYLGKASVPSMDKMRYHFPVETADPHDRRFGNAWMTPHVILDERNRAPEMELLEALTRDGYDISGAQIRIHAMYAIVRRFIDLQNGLADAVHHISAANNKIKNLTVERGSNVSFSGKDKGIVCGGLFPRSL